MKPQSCFECGKPAEYNHHVVPRSRGGTRTVPLCAACHGKAHDITMKNLTSCAMQKLKAAGLYTGGKVLYGYRKGEEGELITNEEEQAVISIMMNYHNQGMGLQKIARHVGLLDIRTRAGTDFTATQVRQIVLNVKNIQNCVYGKTAMVNFKGSRYNVMTALKRLKRLKALSRPGRVALTHLIKGEADQRRVLEHQRKHPQLSLSL